MAKRSDKRRSGTGSRGGARRGGARSAADRLQDPLGVDGLVRAALSGARVLLAVDDPLEAEDRASGVLGAFYKLPVPFDVRERLERTLGMVMALYDENLGGIIKDAFVAELREDVDPRTVLGTDPDVTVQDADPAEAAARIGRAIASGDQSHTHRIASCRLRAYNVSTRR